MLKQYFFLFVLYFIALTYIKTDEGFGEFDFKILKFEECRGPKRKNCSINSSTMQDGMFINFDIQVIQDMPSLKGRLIGKLNDNEMIRLQVKNVCEHFFFKTLFTILSNKVERCGVYKGHFKIRIDVKNIATKFYGGKALYGNWSFSALFWNDYCNFHCDHSNILITPKGKSK